MQRLVRWPPPLWGALGGAVRSVITAKKKRPRRPRALDAGPQPSKKALFRAIPVLPEIMKEIERANAGETRGLAYRLQQKRRIALTQASPVAQACFGQSNAKRDGRPHVRVTRVEASDPKDFPTTDLPEVCFAGRSNVGKSSLLNKVMGKDGFAPTSPLPGETRALIFYCVMRALHLVDLPGYGFAYATEEKREEWLGLMRGYFTNRRQLRHVFVLVDARQGFTPIDRDLVRFLKEHRVPYSIVLTKTDLVPPQDLARHLYTLRTETDLHPNTGPPQAHFLLVSSRLGSGLVGLKNLIANYVDPTRIAKGEAVSAKAVPVPGTLHGQPAKFKLKIPDPDTERPTAEPKTKPKLEGSAQKVVTGPKGCAGKKALMDPEARAAAVAAEDQRLVRAMAEWKAKVKRPLRRRLQNRRAKEARDPSLRVYRKLLQQHRKETGNVRIKRKAKRRLRLLSKVKVGTLQLAIPKTRGQLLDESLGPTASAPRHSQYVRGGETVHLFEETFQPDDEQGEGVARDQRRTVPLQNPGKVSARNTAILMRMEGGQQDPQMLKKAMKEITREAPALRMAARGRSPGTATATVPRPRWKKGRWRDIPKSTKEEDLYEKPVSERQYYREQNRQQRMEREHRKLLGTNPYFLG